MALAGTATLRDPVNRNEPLVTRNLGNPGQLVRVHLRWARPLRNGAPWHLEDSATGRTLCGRTADTWWQRHGGEELPQTAGRFPCSHCTRVRVRWYL